MCLTCAKAGVTLQFSKNCPPQKTGLDFQNPPITNTVTENRMGYERFHTSLEAADNGATSGRGQGDAAGASDEIGGHNFAVVYECEHDRAALAL